MLRRRVVITPSVSLQVLADLSDVQELRVRLIRSGFYGLHEERQLQGMSRIVLRGLEADSFDDEARHRFGPWPKAPRDQRGKVIWSRREIAELGPVIRGTVVGGGARI